MYVTLIEEFITKLMTVLMKEYIFSKKPLYFWYFQVLIIDMHLYAVLFVTYLFGKYMVIWQNTIVWIFIFQS